MKLKTFIQIKVSMFLLLLTLMLTISILPTARAHTITVDGDPSDWIGIPGGDNTYVGHSGEGIWNDMAFDDTGNGSYIYPNCTHDNIPDSAVPGGKALAYTDKYGGPDVEPFWHKHGGMVDFREFRVTGDYYNLYMMLRFENMGNTEIACEWNKGPDRHRYYRFGKIFAQVYIDKDTVSGSGRTDAIYKGNFNFSDECAWELVVSVAGDPHDPDHPPEDGVIGWPRVTFADGTVALINHTDYCYANCDIYPSCIELKVPYSVIGDPRGQRWRFIVVVGGFDEGHWRQVWATEGIGFMQLFRFAGGEGSDYPTMGNDPNIIDMAFTASQAQQEALLNSFSSLVKINKYQDIEFNAEGNVKTTGVGGEISPLDKLALMAPWIAIAAIVIVASTSVVLYRRRTLKNL